MGGGQTGGGSWEVSGSETPRLSGFISPVSRGVDGTTVVRNLSNFVNLVPLGQHSPCPRVVVAGCTTVRGRLAPQPAAQPSGLCVFWKPPFSLPSPLSILLTSRREERCFASSACVSFSPPPSIFQAACTAGGLFGLQELWTRLSCQAWRRGRQGSAGCPLGPRPRPHLVQGGPPPRSTGQDPRYGKWGQEGLGFIQGAACSRQPQMFLLFPDVANEKHFPEKVPDVPFTEQTVQDYKYQLRSAWGPQTSGAGGGVWRHTPPVARGIIQGSFPLAKFLLMI